MYQTFIVDDEHSIRSGLRHIIPWEEYGIEICGDAANGRAALDFIREHRPDIVICDIRMPIMDGLELISEVYGLGIRSRFIVLSGFDDFRYVKEAIKYNVENYLLKPVNVEELKQTVHQVTNKLETEQLHHAADTEGRELIRDNILNRIINNQISSYEFKNKLKLVNPDMSLTDSLLQVAVIDFFRDGGEDGQGDAAVRREAVESILAVCARVIGPDEAISFADFVGRIVIIFIFREGAPDSGYMQGKLQAVYDQARKEAEVRWIVTVGSAVRGYRSLHQSYQHALGIQHYRLYYEERDVLFHDAVMARQAAERNRLSIDYLLLEDAIRSGGREELAGYVTACFEQLSRTGADPDRVYTAAVEIVISTLRILRSLGIAPSEVFADENRLLKTINEFKDIAGLRQWLLDRIGDAVAAIERRNETGLSKVVKDLIAYIDAHYDEDLSLKKLSRDMHFNAVYMGRLFRKETGEVFSEYVNKVRIEKAMHLLRHTNLKVNEISKSCGFGNPNYFGAVFKELAGMTPSEYRNK